MKLLAHVADLLGENRFIIENIDATVIAQAPKMRPYIDTMRENIASVLGLEISQVNVKATTEEGLGFTGRGEAISAQAVCLLSSASELCEDSVSVTDNTRPCETCPGCVAADGKDFRPKADKENDKKKPKDKKKKDKTPKDKIKTDKKKKDRKAGKKK